MDNNAAINARNFHMISTFPTCVHTQDIYNDIHNIFVSCSTATVVMTTTMFNFFTKCKSKTINIQNFFHPNANVVGNTYCLCVFFSSNKWNSNYCIKECNLTNQTEFDKRQFWNEREIETTTTSNWNFSFVSFSLRCTRT